MADIQLTISQGNVEIPLIYDEVHNQQYRALYGYRVGASEPQAKWHVPDDGNSQLIDLIDQNSLAFFNIDVHTLESNAPPNILPGDLVNEAIRELRLWLDGANQEAARYHLIGDNNRVNVKVRRQNSDITTVWGVIYGWVNDSGSHSSATASNNDAAFDVTIALVMNPYGEAESYITLKNEIVNPDVLLEGATAGLADGWSIVGGAGNTLITSNVLIGSQSQRITAPAIMEGIESPAATAPAGDCVAYIWVHLENDKALTIYLRNVTLGSDITSKTIQPNDSTDVSDKRFINSTGDIWYRVSLSATVPANDIAIRVLSAGVLTNFLVDGVYMEFGRTDIPSAWASYCTVLNREDIVTGFPERVNHIHYWGVAGDMPAITQYEIDPDASNQYIFYISKTSDGVLTVDNIQHWADSTDLDTLIAGTAGAASWVTTIDAGASGGSYERFTEDTATSHDAYIFASNTFFANWDLSAFGAIPRRFFVVARSSNSGVITPTVYLDNNLVFTGDDVTVTNTNWSLLDCGTINLVGEINPVPNVTGTLLINTVAIGLEVVGSVTNDTIDIDAFVFLYSGSNDDFLIVVYTKTGATNSMVVDGSIKRVYFNENNVGVISRLGNAWTLKPKILNRVVIISSDSAGTDFDFDIAESFTVQTSILPRTKHLLGGI